MMKHDEDEAPDVDSCTDEELSTEWWYRFHDAYGGFGILKATPSMVTSAVTDENFTYTVENVNERIRLTSDNQFTKICRVSEADYNFSCRATVIMQWQKEQLERAYEKRKQVNLDYFTSALQREHIIKWELDSYGDPVLQSIFNLGIVKVEAYLYRCEDLKLTLQMIFREYKILEDVPSVEAASEEIVNQLKQLRLDIDALLNSK